MKIKDLTWQDIKEIVKISDALINVIEEKLENNKPMPIFGQSEADYYKKVWEIFLINKTID